MKVTELKKYLRVFWHLKKIELMNKSTYKASFIVLLFSVLLQIVVNLLFIKVIFSFIDSIAGWGYFEALIIVGTISMIDGLMLVFFGNFESLIDHVMDGELDGLIVRPIDTQFLSSVWGGQVEDIVRLITGFGVVVYAIINLDITGIHLLSNIIFYIIFLINATIIWYSISLLIKMVVFWTIDDGIFYYISELLMDLGKYPTNIFYHNIVRFLFYFIIPIAFMATVPADILANGFDLRLFIESFILAIIFFVVSRKIWKIGLNHYSSASS